MYVFYGVHVWVCMTISLLCETFIILHIPGHKIDKTFMASCTYLSAALFPPLHFPWKLQIIVTLRPPALLSPLPQAGPGLYVV